MDTLWIIPVVHSPASRCTLYLNMVLYASYYFPMMCCHPMMSEYIFVVLAVIDELDLSCIALGSNCCIMNFIQHKYPSLIQCLRFAHMIFVKLLLSGKQQVQTWKRGRIEPGS